MNYCPFCQLPLDRPVNQCPSCNADLTEHQKTGPNGFYSEDSVDDIRAKIPARKTGTVLEPSEPGHRAIETTNDKRPGVKSSPTVPTPRTKKPAPRPPMLSSADSPDSALPFRPVNRPPTLILCALDDGSRDDGEWYRVRKPEFRIGRTTGEPANPNDIIIANDNGISGTHVEIKLRIEEGRYRYYLLDRGSRNGTFVRISRAALRPDQELLIGARRYFLNAGSSAQAHLTPEALEPSKATRGWEAISGANRSQLTAKLVEMTPRGNGHEFPLQEGENILGKDPAQCTIAITGDPFVSSAHARIFKDKKNRWVIENLNSLNGIWLRIEEMALDTGGEFQIGEQRFLVRIP